jgi:hypothetical protein
MFGNGFGNNFMNNPYCPMPSGYNNQSIGNGPNTRDNLLDSKLYMYYNNTNTIIPQDGRMYGVSIKEIHKISKDGIKVNKSYKLDLCDPNNIQSKKKIIDNRTIVFDRWMFIFMMKVYACIFDYIKFIGGLGHRNLQLEDLKCEIKSITCTIAAQGKQTCGSKIIINLTDEEIEIPTNNIFDVNSLPLSIILKNNTKSTK